MKKSLLPLVSYIVPSFNHANFIEECLESILNDEYKNKELLIIDDGSNDNSVEIIYKWVNKNSNKIKIKFITQENQGICKSLNKIIKYANGNYLRIIASDDLIDKLSTIKFINEFESYKNIDCIFADCKIIDKNNNILYESSLKDFYKVRVKNYLSLKSLKKEIILNWSLCGPSTMYKRIIFDKLGKFDESLIIEDWDMFIRIAKYGEMKFMAENVASYRLHGGNTSRFNQVQKRLLILEHIKKTILKNTENDSSYEDKLLNIKIYIVDAKINYLSKNYVMAAFKCCTYLIKKILA